MQRFSKNASLRGWMVWVLPGVMCALGLMTPSAFAQPANDNFATAQIISGEWGSVSGATTNATAEFNEPSHAGLPPQLTIWYQWTAPHSGEVTLDTLGIARTNDTVIAVYTGTALSNLRQVAANDDLYPRQQANITSDILAFGAQQYFYNQPYAGPSGLRFNAIVGTTYYIAVGMKGAAGLIPLSWAYHSSGVFRFATEDQDPATGQLLYKTSEHENGGAQDISTSSTYYQYGAEGLLVRVTRVGGSSGRVMVNYQATNVVATGNDFSAVPGTDFTPISGTLVFDDFEMTKTILVPIIDRGRSPDTNRVFQLILSNPAIDSAESSEVSQPRVDQTFGRALVRIYDLDIDPVYDKNFQADTNVPPVITFQPTNSIFNFSHVARRMPEDVNGYWASRILVTRHGTNREAVTLNYRINHYMQGNVNTLEQDNNQFPLQPGSDYATPNPADTTFILGDTSDFTMSGPYVYPAGGTLSWGQDDFDSKEINFTVQNDNLTEFNEDFHLFLYRTVNNAPVAVGTVNESSLTILFDDQDPPAGSVDQNHNPDFGFNMKPPVVSVPPNQALPGANGTVYGLALQSDNKPVIVGDFLSYNATPRSRIARLNVDGSLDTSFNPGTGANDFIGAIAQTPTGQFVIGGGFSSYNGSQRIRLARVNSNGSLDAGFASGSGADANIWAIAIQPDGKAIVAGEFSNIGGSPRTHIARLNTNGTVDVTFDPGLNGPNGTVWAVALQADGKILIGGEFTTVNGNICGGIARLNDDGSVDSGFNSGAGSDGVVYALGLQSDGKVLVGGQFSSLDFNPRNGLARLNADGSMDMTFDPSSSGVDGAVYSIVSVSAGIYVGGAFDVYNGTHRRSYARLFSDGTLDTSFMDTAYNQFAGLHRARYGDPRGVVFAAAVQNDGNIMIAGSFSKVGGGQASLQVQPNIGGTTNHLWIEPKSRDGIRNRNNVARFLGGSTPGPGNVSLASESYSANENQSFLSVGLTRANGTLGFLSANFEVESGLAQSGVDYAYNSIPPIYLGTWRLGLIASVPNSTTRMHSDGLFGDNSVPEDINNRTWFNYGRGLVNVTILNDGLSQGDRNSTFRLSAPSGIDHFYLGGENIPVCGALGFSQAPFTILDDDHLSGVLGFESVSFVVNENVTNAVVTVIRTNGSYGSVSCQYATLNISGPTNATQNVDFQPRSGTLIFANGQTNKTFTIPITDDSSVEPDETINVKLSAVSGGASLGLSAAVVTIIDNDTPGGKLNFEFSNFATNEGAGSAIITVTRSGSSSGTLTVYASATNGTTAPVAIAGSDFTGVTNLLTWASGDVTPKTFTVTLLNDVAVELGETVTLRLYTPTLNGVTNNAQLGAVTNATLTILNDDLRGAVQFSTASYIANENGGDAIITVVRSGGSSESISVNFAATPGTAFAGIDFSPTNGTLSFGPGEVSKSFTVPIIPNMLPDAPRFVSLLLSNASPADTIGNPQSAIINLVDDESFNEPPGGGDTLFAASGMNDAVLTLALQSDGKILAGGEFTTANSVPAVRLVRLNSLDGSVDGAFTSSANGTVQSLAIQTDGRAIIGGVFTTVNSVVRNRIARLLTNGALDSTFNPGAGTDNPVFGVAESFLAGGERKILIAGSFSTFNGTARNGIARLNNDGSVDAGFNPGSGADGIVYAVAAYPTNSPHAGRSLICGDFTSINGQSRAGIARLNSDGSLDLSFNPGSGASGSVRALALQTDGRILVGGSFTNFNGSALNRIARLKDDGSLDATFNAGVGADDTVLSITVQGDTKIVVGGLFTHCNGVTRNRITRLKNDGSVDPTINFGAGANNFVAANVVQTNGMIIMGGGFTEYDGVGHQRIVRVYGGSIAGSGTLEYTSATYQVLENSTNATLTVRRRGGTSGLTPGGSISVDSITSDGTAISPTNYIGGTNILVFPEGEVFQTVVTTIIDDNQANVDRTVNYTLSNVLPAGTIGNQPTAVLTIVNDDSAVSFSSAVYTRIENAVDGLATINIVRSGATAGIVTVDFTTTTNGTATAGLDYSATTNQVTFASGETIKSVTIPIANDAFIEGSETVGLALTNISGGFLLSPSTATLTIIDDDLGPGQIGFSTFVVSVAEDAGNATLNLVRTNGSSGVVSVKVQTSDLTATAGLDYTAQNNVTVTFGDGETNKTLLIPVANDSFVEGDEVFNVSLTNATGGAGISLVSTSAVTIVDNDMGFTFSSPFFLAGEAASTMTISVLRVGGSSGSASVTFSTYNTTNSVTNIVTDAFGVTTTNVTTSVSAIGGLDYASATNVLTFANGETVKTFDVTIIEDTLVEGDETFGVLLSNPTPGVQLLTSNALASILDNDPGFTLSTNSYVVGEGATNLVVSVYRTNANTGNVSVSLTTTNITAIAGQDYAAFGNSLNFTNGEASKTILIPIVNDLLVEGDETFQITLSSPSLGAQLVGVASATATIVDNDAGLRFSSASYTVLENGVQAAITVLRESVTNSTVAVNFATGDGTATNAFVGGDYISTNGLLVFTNGEISKTFTVRVTDDTLAEGPETILLSLSSPTGQVSLLNPSAATLTIVDNDGGSIVAAGSMIVPGTESGPVNGAIDPGETVTMLFALRNVSGIDTTNVVATLLATNGVTPLGNVTTNYGALLNNGYSVSRPFTFTASGTNGSPISATFQVQEQSGQSYGRVTFSYVLGSLSFVFSNSSPIAILDNANASPYPSSIVVTGLVGTVSKALVTISNLYHPSPDDIDMLLAGPTGTNVMLMSDCGGGNFLTNVTLTFDDSSASFLSNSGQIVSGTNKPTNFLPDLLPSPAPPPSTDPVAPYGTQLAGFNGSNPNGLWSLYIADDLQIFPGSINNGWQLAITTLGTVAPATDLSLKMTSTPASLVSGSNLTFTITVTNHGPWAATGVIVTNTMPTGAVFVSPTNTPSVTVLTNTGSVVWNIGSLAKDAFTNVTITVSPTLAGSAVSTSTVLGNESDPNTLNNVVSTTNAVVSPQADIAIGVVDSPDPVFIATNNNLTFTISITNLGPSTATAVTITNTLPPGVTFLSATPPLSYIVGGGVVTFTNLGSLGAGPTPLIATITVRVTSPATLTNTTTVASVLPDPFKPNNTVSVKTIVDFPQLGFVKSGNSLVISWDAGATPYTLVSATNLNPPVIWTPVTTPPVVTVGGVNYITNSAAASGNKFFLLRAIGP